MEAVTTTDEAGTPSLEATVLWIWASMAASWTLEGWVLNASVTVNLTRGVPEAMGAGFGKRSLMTMFIEKTSEVW